MARLLRRFVRAGAFLGKELHEIRRQPRLILSLILGPFLILLLFGVGYQGDTGKLSAYVVVPPNGRYSQDPAVYQKMGGGQVVVRGVLTDEQEALSRLDRREIDLVIVVPQDIELQISSGSQVKLPIYFNEIDPLMRDWITYLTYLYSSEINKATVAAAASQGQESAGDVRSAIVRMRNSLDAIEGHMERNEVDQASGEVSRIRNSSANVQLTVALMSQLLASDSALIKPARPQDPSRANLAQGQDVATRLASNIEALGQELKNRNPDRARVKERIDRIREDLDTLDALTQQFQTINPMVLAAPFYADAKNTAPIRSTFTAYYAPGVLMLLLQHIAVTLGALSMVRERLLGTIELFRVSPISPGEVLSGKYVSFLLILSVVSAALLFLMSNNLSVAGVTLSLGVPILGDWGVLALTIALVAFASVGLGFFISMVSRSESQAVQLAMLVLLTSVFFSGFFLRLDTLWPPVQAVSYGLPVTYGITALQNVMLRGELPQSALLLALLMLGTLFGLLAFILFNKEFRKG